MGRLTEEILIKFKDRGFTSVHNKVNKVTQGTRGFNTSMRNMNSLAQSSSGKLSGMASSMAALPHPALIATAAVVGLGVAFAKVTSKAVKAGADLEKTRLKFGIFFGSEKVGNNLISGINELANSTPLMNTELIQAGQQFASFGLEADKIIPVLKAIGNVTEGVGANLNDVSFVMGDIISKKFADRMDVKQIARRSIPIYEALENTLGVTNDKLNEMIRNHRVGFPEIARAFAWMGKEGGKFSGMLEKQSQTFSGLMSTLKGKFQLFTAEVGEKLLPLFKPFVRFLINGFDRFKNLLVSLKPEFKKMKQPLIDLGASIMQFFGTVAMFFKDIIVPALPYMIKGFTFVVKIFTKLNHLILKGFNAMGRLFDAIKASITGLAYAFDNMFERAGKRWQKFIDIFVQIGKGDFSGAKKSFSEMMNVEGSFKEDFKEAYKERRKQLEREKSRKIGLFDYINEKVGSRKQGESTFDAINRLFGKSTGGGLGSESISQGLSTVHAKSPTHVTININTLAENHFEQKGIGENVQRITDEVVQGLATALNDVMANFR